MYGGILALAASSSLVIVDLSSMAGCPANMVNGTDVEPIGGRNPNPIGHYISMQADGTDIYVAFGDTVGHLTGITVTTDVTAVAANQPAAAFTATGLIKLVKDIAPIRVKLPIGQNPNGQKPWGASSQARYLAFLTASTAGVLRIWQSSY
jgi:hypothetical protein